jgi:hypothetical protein
VFPSSNQLERRLPNIGIWMVVAGFMLIVIGMAGEAWYYASLFGKNSNQESRIWQAIWSSLRSVAHPLVYNGVVLYVFGRIVGAWTVSIVGFEHSETSSLRLKGPDEKHTVWIGRKYGSQFEAESAANALRERFDPPGGQS